MKKSYLLVLTMIIIVPLVLGSTLKIWEQKAKKELEKGEVISVSITEEGNIILPPTLLELYSAPEPYLWCLTMDQKGNVFAGSGTEGKVFQIDVNGRGRLFFDSEELQVNSMVVDSAGNLIVATLPNGRIYKVSSGGQVSTLYSPKARYIWSLAIDRAGNIYAGTGVDGIIYKISQSGEGVELFNSEETHIKSMAIDNAGNLIAGSSPKGQVFRISSEGKVYVLYDAPFNEISSIKIDNQGTIYAAAISKEAGKKPPEAKKEDDTSSEDEPSLEIATISQGNEKEKSAIYKISKDNSVEKVWSSTSYIAYSLELNREGNLIIGTGDKGIIYSLTPEGEETLLIKCEEKQVTALASDNRNSIYVATSNLGKILKLSFVHPNQGAYLSQIKDTKTISQWGMLKWQATLKQNTDLRFYTRVGNTSKPDNTWSPWSPPYRNPEGSLISSPAARFIQYKAELVSNNLADTPILHEVSIAYLQKNIKPMISEIKIHPPGIYYKPTMAINEEKELNMPEDFQSFEERDKKNNQIQVESLGKKTYKKGVRFISWKAEDENNDLLKYILYYKASDEGVWKKIAKDIEENSYSWDVTTVPDGRYRIKVEADDARSNPINFALNGELISEPFNIDNTPPKISSIVTNKTSQGIQIAFSALDDFSFIRRASYSIDSSPWQTVYSKDGILDSSKEEFDIVLKKLAAGEHTIILKVEDSMYNIATDKAIVR